MVPLKIGKQIGCNMTKISILGCGWLGLPLAQTLIENGLDVCGSTTSKEKITILKKVNIRPFLLALESGHVVGAVEDFLNESAILIIDIPPKLRGDNKESFVGKIETLIPYIEKSTVENVLFISSTSVYGETNDTITEETEPNPDSESGRQLAIVENLLQSNTHFKTTVLRFGGLVGNDRNPIRFLSGRENIDNPDAPINLIHQEDCIGIILKIIKKNVWGETFNAVTPFHPSRSLYYTQKAAENNLPPPKFNHGKASARKTILSDKVEKMLQYSFAIKQL